jgi:hypothetical protein
MHTPRYLLLAALAWAGLAAGPARAIPVKVDEDETRIFLAELPDNCLVRQQIKAQDAGALPDKLGYRYWRLRVFWLPVWTSNGQFVVYHGSENRPRGERSLGADVATALVWTGLPAERVRTPLAYSCPVGWLVLAGVLMLIGLGSLLDTGKKPPASLSYVHGETTDAAALLADERYQQALKFVRPAAPQAEPTREDIERGLQWLTGQGIPREEAENNLAVLLEAVYR